MNKQELAKLIEQKEAELNKLKAELESKKDWLNEGEYCYYVQGNGMIVDATYDGNLNYTQFKHRKAAEQASNLLKFNNAILAWLEQYDIEALDLEFDRYYIYHLESFYTGKNEYQFFLRKYPTDSINGNPCFTSSEKARQCLSDLKEQFDEFYGVGK